MLLLLNNVSSPGTAILYHLLGLFDSLQPVCSHVYLAGEVQERKGTWRERLHTWKDILRMEKSAGQLNSTNAKYVVEFDMKEVEKSLRKDVVDKLPETEGSRALWIAKRWWRYRPKLPYTYFLHKLDCSEVKVLITFTFLSLSLSRSLSLFLGSLVSCWWILLEGSILLSPQSVLSEIFFTF